MFCFPTWMLCFGKRHEGVWLIIAGTVTVTNTENLRRLGWQSGLMWRSSQEQLVEE